MEAVISIRSLLLGSSFLLFHFTSRLNSRQVIIFRDEGKEVLLNWDKLLFHFDLFFFFILTRIWAFLAFRARIFAQFLLGQEILLTSELTVKDLTHDLFFFWSCFKECLGELHDGHCAFRIANSCHVVVHGNGSQWTVTNFLTVGDFVLPVVVIPDIEESIDTSQVEEATSLWRPTAVSQVGRVVSRLHHWRRNILMPNLSRPITNWKEVLRMSWITPKWVNWTMMLSTFVSESSDNIESFSFICLNNQTLLRSNQVVERTSFSQIFESSAA